MSLRKRVRHGGARQKLEIRKQCPTCKSIDVVDDIRNGNIVCRGCGRVLDIHTMDLNKDWFEFEKEHGRKGQTGRGSSSDNPLLGSMNLTTQIENTREGRTLRRAAGRGKRNKERQLKNSFSQIDALCQKMNLHKKYVMQAKSLYKDLHDKGALRGKAKKTIYAACIFAGCKMEGGQRSLKEVCLATNVSKKEIAKSFDYIKGKLELQSKLNQKRAMSNPAQLVLPYCGYLNLSRPTTAKVENACMIASEKKLFIGRRPDTIASSILYMVTQETEHEKVTPGKISDVTGIAAGTIRSMYRKELVKLKSVLMPKD